MSVLEPGRLVEALGALVTVLALLAIASVILRQWRARSGMLPSRHLTLLETLPLDQRHRLVRVRDKDAEHLLLLGPTTALAVDRRPATEETRP